MFRILAIAGALLGLASVAQADVWRWTDPNGTIHYSDNWVPGSTLVKTESRSSYSSPGPAASTPASGAKNPSPSDQAQAQRDQRAVQADVAKAQAEQCKKVSAAYDKSVLNRRLIKKEAPDGTREYMTDPEADAYRVQLLNQRKQVCGS